MKKFLCMMLALMMVLALAACGGGNDTPASEAPAGDAPASEAPADDGDDAPAPAADLPDEIVIGGLAPLTGEVSFYGISVTNGALLAVEEINAAGGILGKPINYVYYDEKGDATEAINAYNRLVQDDGIVALMGDVTTTPTMAVAEIAAEDGIPMITPTGTGASITEIGDNIFRACYTDPFQGTLMADYAFNELGVETAAILYDTSNDYSVGVAKAFEEKATELGITITANEGYPGDNTDFNSQLTKIKADNPDAIMAPCYYEAAALIIGQARELGIESIMLGPDGWSNTPEQMGGNAGAANNSYYCSQYSEANPSAELQAFMDAYTGEYGESVNQFAVLGYEAIYVLKAAIESAGSVDSAAINAAIKELDVPGLTGDIAYRGGNDPARDAFIIEFVDGAEVVLGTHSVAE